MGPRPQPRMVVRKTNNAVAPTKDGPESSNSVNQTILKNKAPKVLTQMLPPPPPAPTTLLGSEIHALEASLKEAAFHTGRVFRFYSDTRKERIASRAPYPPSSLSRALGRSLERYDQICDTIETQLQHAISVLERDLEAEKARAEREAAAAREASIHVTPSETEHPLTESPTSTHPPAQLPPSGASAISMVPRRGSTILSSLHRPSFPLKLDLSAVALAGGNTDRAGSPMDVHMDLGLVTSLPSPVTLAPKTARALPNDPSIPDIFGVSTGSLGVDNTGQSDSVSMGHGVGMKTVVGGDVIDLTDTESSAGLAALGDSADKPIELDFDDMGIFNVSSNNGSNGAPMNGGQTNAPTQGDVDMGNLFSTQDGQNAFAMPGSSGQDSSNTGPDARSLLASLTSGQTDNSADVSSLLPSGNAGNNEMPSQTGGDAFSGLGDLSSIDLSSFGGFFEAQGESSGTQQSNDAQEEMDLMSQLFTMDGNSGQGEGAAS
ncbi:hypothetical protein M422DRAFT_779031 [Sphaerobolus stellatus SS14]|uniref:Uncharacterized protein n=1 Tax=Sphaerobolus stellatus (strain SS14) TaxID=990650 RepID=A0A0C9W289_SPHS4|nr:hypothetical protein M422DRAFT_779031 [Sphaerobolus stellatus SS14]